MSRKSLESSLLQVGETNENDVLLGSKCRVCDRYYFPQRRYCAACAEPTAEPVELSREATLNSYAVIINKVPYSQIESPYVLGEVMMPEGLVVYTVIRDVDPKKLILGQKMVLDTMEIKKDEENNSVIAYAFKPAG